MKPKNNFGWRARTAPGSSSNWRRCPRMAMFKFRFPSFGSLRPNSRRSPVRSRIQATSSRKPCVQPARRRWTGFLKPIRRGCRYREAISRAASPLDFSKASQIFRRSWLIGSGVVAAFRIVAKGDGALPNQTFMNAVHRGLNTALRVSGYFRGGSRRNISSLPSLHHWAAFAGN